MNELVFIFSNWYSGATLLSILLNNHSLIVCNGETFPFAYDELNKDQYICSCGKHILQCDFYSAVSSPVKHTDGSWNGYFRILPHLSNYNFVNKIALSFDRLVTFRNLFLSTSVLKRRLSSYLDAHLEFYEKARSYFGGACYVDGTKSIRRAELFINNAKTTKTIIKVVSLVRDGRGFCHSFLKNRNLSKNDIKEAMKAWREYILLVDKFIIRYPDVQIKIIRYEDLCSELPKTLNELCDFMGLDFEKSMIDVPTEHHILGNRMRSGFDGNVREDLSWRKNFSKQEIEQINGFLRDDLQKFGYI